MNNVLKIGNTFKADRIYYIDMPLRGVAVFLQPGILIFSAIESVVGREDGKKIQSKFTWIGLLISFKSNQAGKNQSWPNEW